ncbi:MAG: spore coat protein [Clostridiales bacterium]|nr:spore coat protein [Clostridiales bacterium]
MLGEKEILNDFIISQKLLTSSYNTYAGECTNQQLRNAFLNILDDEHAIQANIFENMQSKGWYQTEPADQQKVQQAKQKFGQSQQAMV